MGIVTQSTTTEFEISRPLLITTFDVDFDINVKHTNYVRNRFVFLRYYLSNLHLNDLQPKLKATAGATIQNEYPNIISVRDLFVATK